MSRDYKTANAALATRLENDHSYHQPFGDQANRYEAVRRLAKEFGLELLHMCPPSRELSLALTHLEDVVYNANASIARNEEPA